MESITKSPLYNGFVDVLFAVGEFARAQELPHAMLDRVAVAITTVAGRPAVLSARAAIFSDFAASRFNFGRFFHVAIRLQRPLPL